MIKAIFIMAMMFTLLNAHGQYKQEETQKYPERKIFPQTRFDSLQAKAALAYGNTTVKGVAFTKPRTVYGYKAPLASRIYANHIVVELFPLTPYFEEWYKLKDKEENLKKNKVVYMDSAAYRYRITCETNSEGKFTFPKMKPGKYIIIGTLPWSDTRSYDEYTESGYGNYGDRTDYYQRQYYTTTHSDFLIQVIEVKPGDNEMEVKLK